MLKEINKNCGMNTDLVDWHRLPYFAVLVTNWIKTQKKVVRIILWTRIHIQMRVHKRWIAFFFCAQVTEPSATFFFIILIPQSHLVARIAFASSLDAYMCCVFVPCLHTQHMKAYGRRSTLLSTAFKRISHRLPRFMRATKEEVATSALNNNKRRLRRVS